MVYSSRHLAQVLRDTIRSVEQGTDLSPDDPALLELKRILLAKIAVLELEGAQETAAGPIEVSLLPPIDSN